MAVVSPMTPALYKEFIKMLEVGKCTTGEARHACEQFIAGLLRDVPEHQDIM